MPVSRPQSDRNAVRSMLTLFVLTCGILVAEDRVSADESPTASDVANVVAPRLSFNPTEQPTVEWLPAANEVPDASAASGAAMKPYVEQLPGSQVSFRMLPIPAGLLLMKSPDTETGRKANEGPQREVEVEPFWMGQFEVTWSEFELWATHSGALTQSASETAARQRSEMLADAITRPTKPFADLTFGMGRADCPAICMTQLAARCYCKWLSAKTGRYYRLPTEAEWEYACRAGTTGGFSFGRATDEPGDFAWYFDNGSDHYHKVGTRQPNPWGLYDMHGNVSEWVLDRYAADAYSHMPSAKSWQPFVGTDQGSTDAGASYVVRGGSWDSDPAQLRSAARDYSRPEWKNDDPRNPKSIWYNTEMTCPGFRVVRPLRIPTAEQSVHYEPDWKEILDYSQRQTADHTE